MNKLFKVPVKISAIWIYQLEVLQKANLLVETGESLPPSETRLGWILNIQFISLYQ